jgi:serine/threonine protein kinase
MELLRGINLQQLVTFDGPLPPSRVVHLLRQACGALTEAHAAGLIHRDIKPANLMLCEYGGIPDFLKVLDFGLVKDVGAVEQGPDGQVSDDPGSPRTGRFRHAPSWGPRGCRSSKVDGRTDIFALGAVGCACSGSPVPGPRSKFYPRAAGPTVPSGGAPAPRRCCGDACSLQADRPARRKAGRPARRVRGRAP